MFEGQAHKLGLILPSSNLTMERELPTLLRAREAILPERFSVHGARMRLKTVSAAALKQMDGDSLGCAQALADARVQAQIYACLVAIMSQGPGTHRSSEVRLSRPEGAQGPRVPTISSAGALVRCLQRMGARRIALICPYMRPLAQAVVDYLAGEGIQVVDWIALEIPNNLDVGARDPMAPARLWRRLALGGVQAIVASACVQMPSLASIPEMERDSGLPTLSAATASLRESLQAMGLPPIAPGGGCLLDPNSPHYLSPQELP